MFKPPPPLTNKCTPNCQKVYPVSAKAMKGSQNYPSKNRAEESPPLKKSYCCRKISHLSPPLQVKKRLFPFLAAWNALRHSVIYTFLFFLPEEFIKAFIKISQFRKDWQKAIWICLLGVSLLSSVFCCLGCLIRCLEEFIFRQNKNGGGCL